MKKILFLAAVAAFTLSSCSKDTPVSGAEGANSGEMIGIRTNFDKSDAATRGTLTHANDFSNFTLNAIKSNNPSATFDFMKLFGVVKDVTGSLPLWVYHPVKYYPGGGVSVSFFAISPSGSVNATAMTTVAGGASASFNYTVPLLAVPVNQAGNVNEHKQEDLLVASTKLTTGDVALTFKHALSAVSFKAMNKSTAQTFIVHSVKLTNLKNKGTMLLTPTGTAVGGYAWTPSGNFDNTYVASLPEGGVSLLPAKLTGNTPTSYKLTSENEWLMVLPQTLTNVSGGPSNPNAGEQSQYSYIAVEYSSYDGNFDYTHDHEVKYLPIPKMNGGTDEFVFAKNTKYTFTYEFSLAVGDEVKIGAIDVSDWSLASDIALP